uniref:Uncharacterized protein n=1 Tax=Arundo donax TaxID=35708 RepID=A0A0A9H1M9_ARUDO
MHTQPTTATRRWS